MRVLVTGGAGFLGRRLVDRLRARPDVERIVVLDVAAPADPRPGVEVRLGSLTDRPVVDAALADAGDVIVHLASMVSAGAEAAPAEAMAVNVGGMLALLDAAGRLESPPRLVFASSVAVFGPPAATAGVGDVTKLTPRTVYGTTKAIGELLVDDATRRGVVDGRTARLPTVIVRPGAPNAAASGFASGMFREPLAGVAAVVPVAETTPIVVIGPETAVGGIEGLIDLEGERLGPDRASCLPGVETDVGEMLAVLTEVGGASARALVTVQPDPATEGIVSSWPSRWDDRRARALGLPADDSLTSIVREYVDA
ncbi:MAG: NAD-dependent epimerase/dehydratase family protein [Actinomycetota bacterium]